MDGCIFCKIVSGEAPCDKVAENEDAVAFRSIAPIAETHVLIVPKMHIETFLDSNDDKLMGSMVRLSQEVIQKEKIKNAYKIAVNGGSYQIVKHLHWHVLGGKFMKSVDET